MKPLLLVLILFLRIEALKTATNKVLEACYGQNNSQLICLMNSGYKFFLTRFYSNSNAWESYSLSLGDVQKAGCSSDIIISLDLRITQANFIASIFRDIPVALYGMLWVDLVNTSQFSDPSC
jgi:hypothetical protein